MERDYVNSSNLASVGYDATRMLVFSEEFLIEI